MPSSSRIQHADQIYVRRDIVAVSVNAKTIWSAPLHGQNILLTTALEKAGIKLDPADTSRYEIRTSELRSSPLHNPPVTRRSGNLAPTPQFRTSEFYTLAQLANGDAPDEQLEAGDSINIIRAN